MNRVVEARGGIVVVLFALLVGCQDVAGVSVAPDAACPSVPTRADGVYPTITYVTFFIDGEVVLSNQRYLHRGVHHSGAMDTVPSRVDNLDPNEVETIIILNSQKAAALGVCPGVRAVAITTKATAG